MKSVNFEILRDRWRDLAELGGFAESYASADPASALVKLRLFAEKMTEAIYRDCRLPQPDRPTLVNLLQSAAFVGITPKVVLDKLHALRIYGNKAAHGEAVRTRLALWLLKEAYDLARWFCVKYGECTADTLAPFSKPVDAALHEVKERRRFLERIAEQEARLEEVFAELEEQRAKVKATVGPREEAGAAAKAAADELDLDEALTRTRLIDAQLVSTGWDVGDGPASTDEVGKEVEVDQQPTKTGIGYADYVLWDEDGSPLALIEAKRTAAEAERGRKQAKLYADGLEHKHGTRPVIFYTNGFDIWMWDDSQGFPPRRLFGFYSKDSLQRLARYQRTGKQALDAVTIDKRIVDRLYQIEAIKRVAERFTQKHRKALIVQATGTGKTRVAIALADLMIRARWVKRVLFLCDRKELRRQAKNAFGDFVQEPVRVVTSRIGSEPSERVFLATYPAMRKVFRSFDPGFFDLIVADESHRSIYNVYGDMFRYFDCFQVGLTATPVDFVTRNTFQLFDCEDRLPTANYGLEQAVEDGYLVPFEVYDHTTQFRREGINLDGLSAQQIEQLESQGEDPNDYEFAAEQIDKRIYNRDTNRTILRNLMERGIRDGTDQFPGKSIVFARNHQHAMLLRELFDEMYPQYGGRFCQVIDNYDPRAEQLIDDFKGMGKNEDLMIAISVDMLDTGIDVPEVLNLVFAKPLRSPVKFWQMIGRGTRLCPDLFGPGKDKRVFRIFDHWGNFARFETSFKPAEPVVGKSMLQRVFEARLDLAEIALRNSEVEVFGEVVDLIAGDIAALPEESIAVREKWREKRALGQPEILEAFAPSTVARLRTEIAPLMQWRYVRGSADALALDLLITRMQRAALTGSSELADLRIQLMDGLSLLQAHLNPVREKAAVIRRAKSEAFWDAPTVAELEALRVGLRGIMHHREREGSGGIPAKVIDVAEDRDGIRFARRSANVRILDMRAYEQLVEAELRKHFETEPVLRKIRAGQPVSDREIEALVSLVLVQNGDVPRAMLEEFFSATASPLYVAIRSIVGMDPKAVSDRFAGFVQRHPMLTAKQTRFLALLQNHITRYGTIEVERLYDAPFTVIDADGPDGVFTNEDELSEFIAIVHGFSREPALAGHRATDDG